MSNTPASRPPVQLLHLVIGGELKAVDSIEFRDLSKMDFAGAFPDYDSAYRAWKAKAQATVDNAHVRYFIVHAHRLLDPDMDGRPG
jgi:myo-inositol-1(or 4)-monophosphatase